MVARLLLAMLVLVTAAGCGGDASADGDGDGRLRVVTTVAPITSIVANVAGDAADVRGIVPEGTNSHTFEPPPSVAAVLARADVVILNGLQLEEPTRKLAEANVRAGTPIVQLGDEVLPAEEQLYDVSFPRSGGKPNPHLWTDPPLVKRYVEVVRDTLVELAPDAADAIRRNAAAFSARIDALDAAMREAFETVPPGSRKLLTYHDAYAYFARDYGWEVIGAIQVEDFREPSPREVAALIRQVRETGVPAIFGSEVFPSPVLAQIGREAGVTYVDVLRDDDLPGRPGDPGHSWLGLMRFDYATIVRALGGDPAPLERLDVSDVVPDRATYPQ